MTLSDTVITKTPNPSITNSWTDWVGYRDHLEKLIELNVPFKNLENETKIFIEQLQQTGKVNTPEIRKKTPGRNYTLEVRELVLEKRKVRRQWQKSRNPETKTLYNRLSQQLKRYIHIIKNQEITEFLQELTAEKDNNYSLWKTTKKIKRPIIDTPPIRKLDRTWARNSQEKADAHADHLEGVF